MISSMNLLAIKIREFRALRGWTQDDLAKRSGVNRGSLASIETGKAANPSVDIFLKLARAFNIRPEELYQAAGYIKDNRTIRPIKETSEDILERLRLAHPVSIPVYTEFPFYSSDGVEPVEYVFRSRTDNPKNVEGYLIRDDSLPPTIIKDDIVIVDRDAPIYNGDIVLALVNGRLYISRFRKNCNEMWLENNYGKIKFDDCQVASPVIEVIRRLKRETHPD